MRLKKFLTTFTFAALISTLFAGSVFAAVNDPDGIIFTSVAPAQIRAGKDSAVISYQITQPINDLTISIYDHRNAVRVLMQSNRRIQAGNYQIFWDGTNANGQNVPAGVYRYIITSSAIAIGLTDNITVINASPSPIRNFRSRCFLPSEYPRCLKPF